MALTINKLSGSQIQAAADHLAQMRIKMFREFPYLYEGTIAYEKEYLKQYTNSEDSLFLTIEAEGNIVGMLSSLPLADTDPGFQKPFVENGDNVDEIFYIGEVIIEPAARGHWKITPKLFDKVEAHAKEKGFKSTVFCTVVRPEDHPMRPKGYRPLDLLCKFRGYEKLPGYLCHFEWQDVGQDKESTKPLQYWRHML